MSTTQRGRRAQTEIAQAAAALIVEEGVDGFSLREAARRAGYAPSAVYNHFRNKDELIIAVAIAAVQRLAGYLHSVPSGAARERLLMLAERYVAFADDHPQDYRLIFDCLSNPPHAWNEFVQVADPFTVIIEACAAGLESGDLVAPQPGTPAESNAAAVAYGLWALVDGHVHLRQKHLAHIQADYPALLTAAVTTYLDGLRPEPVRPGAETPKPRSKSPQSKPAKNARRKS